MIVKKYSAEPHRGRLISTEDHERCKTAYNNEGWERPRINIERKESLVSL